MGWRPLVDEGPTGDLDADLRVALLALLVGGPQRLAVNFLRQSAKEIRESSKTESHHETSDTSPLLARLYRKLRSQSAKTLLEAQSAGSPLRLILFRKAWSGMANRELASSPQRVLDSVTKGCEGLLIKTYSYDFFAGFRAVLLNGEGDRSSFCQRA
jgi:hypothetical protein